MINDDDDFDNLNMYICNVSDMGDIDSPKNEICHTFTMYPCTWTYMRQARSFFHPIILFSAIQYHSLCAATVAIKRGGRW